jgi:CcmD family protein
MQMHKMLGTRSWGRRMRAVLGIAALVTALGAFPAAQQQPPAGSPDEFVPIDSLQAEESLPAAPLVIGAYAVAWLAVFGYLWSIRQRTNRVERDLAELSRRVGPGGNAR